MTPALESPTTKLGAFAVVLGLVLGGGVAVGQAVGPLDVGESHDGGHGDHGPGASAGDTGNPGGTADAGAGGHVHGSGQPMAAPAGDTTGSGTGGSGDLPAGVLVAQDGYRLAVERNVLDGVEGAPFRFRIVGSGGSAVREFAVEHGLELHLIIVSRDLATFAHLHPTRAADGTWTAYLPALAAGAYRAFADFTVAGGPRLTLGVDLSVSGTGFSPAPLPPPSTTALVDGYEVSLDGVPAAGASAPVELRVSRNGAPVTHLDPYLGADGHLVAIRAGDLAYVHVHPLDGATDGAEPATRFGMEVPSPGDYRLFFEFAHGGEVHTAPFTVRVPAGGHDDRAGGEEEQ